MKVLILYGSQFGATREIAVRIARVLGEHGQAVDVCPFDAAPNPACYDALVIGSAIHGGHWLRPAAEFLRREQELIAQRPVWLFSSGPIGDLPVRSPQPDPKEVAELRHSTAFRDHRVFAGAFDRATANINELGLVERTIVSRFLPEGDWRDWPAIDRWAESIARELEVPARAEARPPVRV